MQNIAINWPSGHRRTTLLRCCIFATKACIDNREKNVKQQYLLQMSPQYGELRPTNGRDRFRSLWHPSKFQRASCLAFVTPATSHIEGQTNFARCLAVSCADTLYIHFWRLLPHHGTLPSGNTTKFGPVRGVVNRNLFPKFREL